jgi:APA family basic amino acid/polyamine antiporter
VLVYYFVANVAAFGQPPSQRRYPKAMQVAGAAACLVLVATLPVAGVIGGVVVLVVGVIYRSVAVRT